MKFFKYIQVIKFFFNYAILYTNAFMHLCIRVKKISVTFIILKNTIFHYKIIIEAIFGILF